VIVRQNSQGDSQGDSPGKAAARIAVSPTKSARKLPSVNGLPLMVD